MGLPPTSSKLSTDTSNVTTFNYQFPNFTGIHTGITTSLGINSVAGGGTGLGTLTANNVILGNGTSTPLFVAPGTAGNILTDNGTTWISSTPVGNSAFISYYSSQVTTNSSAITSGTFTTFSNSPALTFTPTISGSYKVYCAIPVIIEGSGGAGVVRIYNTSGSATLRAESQGYVNGIGATYVAGDSGFAQSEYTLIGGTSYTFDIQGLQLAGSSGIVASGANASFYMFAEGIGLATPSGGSGLTEAQVWARISYGM
jgi:hypothetical protein